MDDVNLAYNVFDSKIETFFFESILLIIFVNSLIKFYVSLATFFKWE